MYDILGQVKKVSNEELGIGPETRIADAPDDEEAIAPNDTILTDERAEALADEAISRGWANLVPGGKSLSGDGRHSPVFQVRLPSDLRDRLHDYASKQGVSDSKVARAAIEAYLNAS